MIILYQQIHIISIAISANISAGAATGATTGIGSTAFCVDKSVPGRASDCPAQKALCDQPLYRDLMTDQCPRTCNRCGVVSPLRGNLNGLQQNPNVFGLGGTVPATQGCFPFIWKHYVFDMECIQPSTHFT